MHIAGGINPDSGIRVACAFPDGKVKVYDALPKKGSPVRRFLFNRYFTNYGQAKLWADEFEIQQRKMKAKEEE